MYKDKVDDEILRILKDDSRESFVDIGKKLKLSESAVRRRVKNLTDNQIIKKFTIEIGEQNATKARYGKDEKEGVILFKKSRPHPVMVFMQIP